MPLDIIGEGGGDEHPLKECYKLWIIDGSKENTDLLVKLIKYYETQMGLGFISFLRKSGLDMQLIVNLAYERLPDIQINLVEIAANKTIEEVTEILRPEMQRAVIQSGLLIVLNNNKNP